MAPSGRFNGRRIGASSPSAFPLARPPSRAGRTPPVSSVRSPAPPSRAALAPPSHRLPACAAFPAPRLREQAAPTPSSRASRSIPRTGTRPHAWPRHRTPSGGGGRVERQRVRVGAGRAGGGFGGGWGSVCGRGCRVAARLRAVVRPRNVRLAAHGARRHHGAPHHGGREAMNAARYKLYAPIIAGIAAATRCQTETRARGRAWEPVSPWRSSRQGGGVAR